jgi:hypothetical protein
MSARTRKMVPPKKRLKAPHTWTDEEVRNLVDVVLLARDVELADRLFTVLASPRDSAPRTSLKALNSKPVPVWQSHPAGQLIESRRVPGLLCQALKRFVGDPNQRDRLKVLVALVMGEINGLQADANRRLEAYAGSAPPPGAEWYTLARGE